MKPDQLEKEYLKDRILPLLFCTKNAKIFISAKNVFKRNDTSIQKLQRKYEKVDTKNEEFWDGISDLVAESFNENKPTYSAENFRQYIEDLLKIRFKKGFRKNDVKKFEETTDIESFLEDIGRGNNIVLKDGTNPKIIYGGHIKTREYTDMFKPEEIEFYPPLLIEIDKDNNQLLLSGNKTQRSRFIRNTEKMDAIKLEDEEPEEYEELKIKPSFISNLKSQDIFLRKIKLSSYNCDISLNVSSGKETPIDIQDFVDYDLLLHDKQDILSINECTFTYVKKEEDVEFKLNFQTFKRIEGNQEFIKIALELPDEYEKYRDEIETILKKNDIEVYEPYYKPSSFYINKLLTTNSNYRIKYLQPLEEMSKESGLEILYEKDILKVNGGESIDINKDKLTEEIYNILKNSERSDIQLEGREYRITSVDYDKSLGDKITLILKSYSDDPSDEHRRFYKVILATRTQFNKFDKIYNVILPRVNYHKILTAKGSEEVIEYIVKASQRQFKYHQQLMVEKESRRSIKILEDYYFDPDGFRERFADEKRAGYEIEDHINVLMRYLFGNYLSGGGANETDGALQLNDKIFLIDSKQRKDIPKSELSKSKEDLEESKYSKLIKSESIIWVICKKLLRNGSRSGSLNKKARERVTKNSDYEFLFMSIEFIIHLFKIFSENKHFLLGSHSTKGKIFGKVQEFIEESKNMKDCNELESLENEYIGKIRKIIDRDSDNYIPERRGRYF